MQKFKKDRLIAGFLAVITAFSPISSSMPVYASNTSNSTSISVETETETTDADSISVETEEDVTEVSENKVPSGAIPVETDNSSISVESLQKLTFDFSSYYGEVVVKDASDKDGSTEKHLRVSKSKDDKKTVTVTNKKGKQLDVVELSEDKPYALELEKSTGSVVHIEAIADDGYDVATYSITLDSGANKGMKQAVGFTPDTYSKFENNVSMDVDKTIKIVFNGLNEKSNETSDENSNDGAIYITTDDGSGIKVDSIDVETENKDDNSSISVETEATEVPNDDVKVETSEYFMNDSEYDTSGLNKEDFSTMRLLMVADEADIIDKSNVIGSYDNLYLLQYTTVQQAMNAYAYYSDKVEAIEPDKEIKMAEKTDSEEDETVVSDVEVTASTPSNPVAEISELDSLGIASTSDIIALIDTGVSDESKTVGRFSVLDDDKLAVGTHGDNMADVILSQNVNAQILSIRAMDENGTGTISSIVAAMQYAIDNNVSIINLSLSAKKSLSNSVLEKYIKDASANGIIVVGAAGNYSSDVKDYVPGFVDEAYIIGAANADGSKNAISNYGSTVDYNVVADSTSVAAATFTGVISRDGFTFSVNDDLIYLPDYIVVEDDEEDISETTDDSDDMFHTNRYEFDCKLMSDGDTRYSDYYNNWYTHKFTVNDGDNDNDENSAIRAAYCVDPKKHNPIIGKNGTTYKAHYWRGTDNMALKIFGYPDLIKGYVTDSKGNVDTGKLIVLRHILLSRAAGNNWSYQVTDEGQRLANKIWNELATKPVLSYNKQNKPKTDVCLKGDTSKKGPFHAEIKNGYQESKVLKFYSSGDIKDEDGDDLYQQSVTLPAKSKISYVLVDADGTEHVKNEGQAVKITDGQYFKVRASLGYSGSVTITQKCDIPYAKAAYVDSAGEQDTKQPVAFGYRATKSVSFRVDFTGSRPVQIKKALDVDSGCAKILYGLGGSSVYPKSGAKFQLKGKATNKTYTVVTDANGNTPVIDVVPDKYVITEIEAPKNSLKSSEKKEVEIAAGESTKTVTFTNSISDDPFAVSIGKYDSMTSDGKAGVSGDNDFSDAKFRLYYFNTESYTSSSVLSDLTAKAHNNQYKGAWDFNTDKNGYFNAWNGTLNPVGNTPSVKVGHSNYLPVGLYLVEEIAYPKYFSECDVRAVFKVSMNSTNTDAVTHYITGTADTKQIANGQGFDGNQYPNQEMLLLKEPSLHFGIQIQKYDAQTKQAIPQGDADFSGVTYGVWNASDKPVMYGDAWYAPDVNMSGSYMFTMTTDAKGYAKSAAVLPNGTYKVKEISSTNNYLKQDTNVYTYTIHNDGSYIDGQLFFPDGYKEPTGSQKPGNIPSSGFTDGSKNSYNPVKRAGLYMDKVDYLLKQATGNGSGGQGDTTLKDAEFAIINASKESVASSDGKKLYGTIASELGNSTPNYHTLMNYFKTNTNNCVVDVIKTDDNGHAQTGINALPVGTYYVIETKAPVGKDGKTSYKINQSYIAKVQVTGSNYNTLIKAVSCVNAEMGVVAGQTHEVPDEIYRGGVHVQKFDEDRDDDRGHGDTDLSNAEFTIVNASDKAAVNADGDLISTLNADKSTKVDDTTVTYGKIKAAIDTKKYTMGVIKTDAKGDAVTGNYDLPYGTYYIIETKAPTGRDGEISYHVNTTWVGKVIVREDGKMYDVETVKGDEHDLYNHTYYPTISRPAVTNGDAYATRDKIYASGIAIQKVDAEMKKQVPQGIGTLKDAEFTIINASDYSIRNVDGRDIATAKNKVSDNSTWDDIKKLADDGKYTVQTIKTNVEGYAATNAYDLPYGTYYVIETKSSYGYYLDDNFVGKVIVRDDGLMMSIGQRAQGRHGKSSFVNLGARDSLSYQNVVQVPRRGDVKFQKVDADGQYKAYLPFLISLIRKNDDGTETVLESHIMVTDENGRIDTSDKTRRKNPNAIDNILLDKTVRVDKDHPIEIDNVLYTDEKELLKAASKWCVWFQGNSDDALKTAFNQTTGALVPGYYRITELKCKDNDAFHENLLASDVIYVYNDTVPANMKRPINNDNNKMFEHHPLVDLEVDMKSVAFDVEATGDIKHPEKEAVHQMAAREEVDVKDYVEFTNVSADHKYRMETQFIDVTDGNKPIKIIKTKDADAKVTDDGLWVTKEFYPKKQSGTNNTYDNVTLSATINTKQLNGHKIMAIDYLYEYVDVTPNDNQDGSWLLIAKHPYDRVEKGNDVIYELKYDESQMLYVPDLHTQASDILTNDRVGAKSEVDGITDTTKYENLNNRVEYVVLMSLKDLSTGKYVDLDANLNKGEQNVKGYMEKDGRICAYYRFTPKGDTPLSGTLKMPTLYLDSSKFANNTSLIVVEEMYYTDGDGNPVGEPILQHDSLLDENQTIRYIDIQTTASDKNTKDHVGTDEDVATVYDNVKLTNVIFDDNDNDGMYTYTVKGCLVYQKDFTDANGVNHKAGDAVDTLDGTKNVVTIQSDAAGNVTFLYADGSAAKGKILKSKHGMNVGHSVNDATPTENGYVTDNTSMVCDLEVEMIYKLNSNNLAGGTVVVYDYLYHDAKNTGDIQVAAHEDITDKGQTVHYPKVRTSAVDTVTKDDVGALRDNATIIDTVKLTNLVPGNDYQISGKLMDQMTGKDFLVNGKTVVQTAHITVTKDGKLVSGDGEKVTVTSYDEAKNEVCGTVDLTFTFDARGLEDRTCVVFEDLYHNNVKVATHSDLKDKNQTVHFPKIRTTNTDGYTKDHVATVHEKGIIVDTVSYSNLVPGREYTVNGVLMNKDTQEKLLDKNGKEVTASRTFVAGSTSDGIVVTKADEEHNSVSGTIDITFEFDASLLEGVTVVVFEDLYHNDVLVTTHSDLEDEEQTVHYPKLRTSALDMTTGDEVGVVGKTQINDIVRFWNLIPEMEYEVRGVLMDKDTGKPLEVDGKTITQTAIVKFTKDGKVDTTVSKECTDGQGINCTEDNGVVSLVEYDEKNHSIDGAVVLQYELDASLLEDKTVVVYEDLYHNGVKVTTHSDISDLAQTIHFPKIRTEAVDIDTSDHAGTVKEEATVVDTVKYSNLVINKIYSLKGVLYNQKTGAPILGEDGRPISASATFVATKDGDGDTNKVTSVNEENQVVSGEYKLVFYVNSAVLAGETVVVFEDLYHNDVLVTTHSDLKDKNQSVHYPNIHTTAIDSETGDHVGSIFGGLINGFRQLFGETDADGNGIADEKQQNIIDTVALDNLVPGYTYVVSGKLFDVDKSLESDEEVPIMIDGKEIVQAVTITVSEDGKEIISSNGSKTSVTEYDEENNRVNGTVDLVYTLDSSKVQGVKAVVFEYLYHDSTYTKDMNPTDVKEEDIIHKHAILEDENQSVSDVSIQTTALDTTTNSHVGVVPVSCTAIDCVCAVRGVPSVIQDTVNMTKLVPEMDYTIKGYLVDLGASDFANGKVYYLAADGTSTTDKSLAITQIKTFTASESSESQVLNFGITSDKVQGKSITVFEELWHNNVKISMHPAGAINDIDKDAFKEQSVYYPTGKTNATDNVTNVHTALAGDKKTITDRVYFENLVVGEEYTIDGYLVYQNDFTDVNNVKHKAGERVDDTNASVTFVAAVDMKELMYVNADGKAAVVDDLKVTELPNGQKTVSGYINIDFTVNASQLAGQSVVAYEDFKRDDATLFVHHDLNDKAQTVKFPEIHTNAKSLDLDEASVYDEKTGAYKEVVITDTVTYHNLWTQGELDSMAEEGKYIKYADGTFREQKDGIYDIHESAQYMLRGVLMDKETGETLKDKDGKEYVMYSEAFSPESGDGTKDVVFTINPEDFVKDGVSELEGKSVVVFEDLYLASKVDECVEDTHIVEHHDINDNEQDIRFPKLRTHALDGVEGTDETQHASEISSSDHESYGTENMKIVDTVSFNNLHGAAKYTVSGTLQVVTEYNEDGTPKAWETAKDDAGKEITASVELDTTKYSEDYDASVSGTIDLVFEFSGVNLQGKTLVVFENLSREGKVVGVHADINDDKQTIYVPKIQTSASEALTGLNEMKAGSDTVILDKVSYENLEKGKTYNLTAVLHKKSDGSELSETRVVGTFVAGTENQIITTSGTAIMTVGELRNAMKSADKADKDNTKFDVKTEKLEIVQKNDATVRVNGEVTVMIPVDTSKLGGETVVAFETLTSPSMDSENKASDKVVATHEDIDDEAQSVHVPKIQTSATIDGKKASIASKKMTVTDKVTYTNLTVGTEYTVHGVLMDKTTGKSLKVVADKTFKPESADGTVDVTFTFDGSELAGRQLVVFEQLTRKDENGKDVIVAVHEDINDAAQTVSIQKPKSDKSVENIDTGDGMMVGFAVASLAMLILLLGLYMSRKKRSVK